MAAGTGALTPLTAHVGGAEAARGAAHEAGLEGGGDGGGGQEGGERGYLEGVVGEDGGDGALVAGELELRESGEDELIGDELELDTRVLHPRPPPPPGQAGERSRERSRLGRVEWR